MKERHTGRVLTQREVFLYDMDGESSRELVEAERLLGEIGSWSEEEVEELPLFYREKAREYRSDYPQPGEQ